MSAAVRQVADLSAAERARMFEIMSGHFENVSESRFFADLDEKDVVVVMTDAQFGELRGFSTIGRLTAVVNGEPVLALFAGDTVIEPEFWGESAWLSVWAQYAFSQADRVAPSPLYWLLCTATHRSYRLLAGIFRDYYPRHDRPTPPAAQARLDALATAKFGHEYDPARGIISLVEQTPVRPERLDPATEERDAPEVRFFKSRNPDYARGDFLACLSFFSRDDLTALGRRLVEGR
jgi:hypothetical protein